MSTLMFFYELPSIFFPNKTQIQLQRSSAVFTRDRVLRWTTRRGHEALAFLPPTQAVYILVECGALLDCSYLIPLTPCSLYPRTLSGHSSGV
jgi:hypothetical protein